MNVCSVFIKLCTVCLSVCPLVFDSLKCMKLMCVYVYVCVCMYRWYTILIQCMTLYIHVCADVVN